MKDKNQMMMMGEREREKKIGCIPIELFFY
jgi:hypothetical protein